MDRYITWPYQVADHYCRTTGVYNKYTECNGSAAYGQLRYSSGEYT